MKESQLILVTKSDVSWLHGETRRQIRGCAVNAYNDVTLYTPDGEGQYPALWTRDFSYMVENAAEFIPHDHISAAIQYLLDAQREDGCIPDRIRADGRALYSAGPDDQPLGEPPADNSQFMVKLVADYVALTQDTGFFSRISGQLISAMNYTPRHSSGLVHIDSQIIRSPYGFTDTVAKTGELLFSSLLYWEASNKLIKMCKNIGDLSSAEEFQSRVDSIEKNITSLWDEESGMFQAASGCCRQIDIWGNAYAVYIGFPLGDKKSRIIDYLAENFNAIAMKGQVRHLPKPDHWEKTLYTVEPETYQNGAYWGTASGWLAFALFEKHPDLSRKIYLDLIADYRANGVFECINTGYSKIINYVVSVTNPLGAIRKITALTA